MGGGEILPSGYTRSVNSLGEPVIIGPGGGTYRSTGLADTSGNTIYRGSDSHYFTFNGGKESSFSPFTAGLVDEHHPIPIVMGGADKQLLVQLTDAVHSELHTEINVELVKAGIPLKTTGGTGNTAQDWVRYFYLNPDMKDKAFSALLDASRTIDAKYNTQITTALWDNILKGKFN